MSDFPPSLPGVSHQHYPDNDQCFAGDLPAFEGQSSSYTSQDLISTEPEISLSDYHEYQGVYYPSPHPSVYAAPVHSEGSDQESFDQQFTPPDCRASEEGCFPSDHQHQDGTTSDSILSIFQKYRSYKPFMAYAKANGTGARIDDLRKEWNQKHPDFHVTYRRAYAWIHHHNKNNPDEFIGSKRRKFDPETHQDFIDFAQRVWDTKEGYSGRNLVIEWNNSHHENKHISQTTGAK